MLSQRTNLYIIYKNLADLLEAQMLSSAAPHPFIVRLLTVFGWEKNDLLAFIRGAHADLEDKIIGGPGARKAITRPLEQYCHKIWLTSVDAPNFPPIDFLAGYFDMVRNHPPDWTHVFWSNNAEVVDFVNLRAIETKAKVLVNNIDTLHLGRLDRTVRSLVSDKKYVLAADVLKFIVLDRFGGIYSDLGICFDQSILQMASAVDYSFVLAGNLFFQTSWVSLRRRSLLSTMFLAIIDNPEVLSPQIVLDESNVVSGGTEVHTFCGLGYTACTLLFLPDNASIFIFSPNSNHMSWRSQQSWYGSKPKHGNVLISATKPTLIRSEFYKIFENEACKSIKSFRIGKAYVEKLKTLVKLSRYFESNPTELCEYFRFNGSEKASSWHNYGFFYHFVLGRFRGVGCKVLEISDSRTLWGPASGEASRTPKGGTMMVWETYLNATAFGAEIDRQEQRLNSLSYNVRVNGEQLSAITTLFDDASYDVIIDNGFHDFESAKQLLAHVVGTGGLSARGIYFIESIPRNDISKWEAFLGEIPNAGAIVSLPLKSNSVDNNIVIVHSLGGVYFDPSRGS